MFGLNKNKHCTQAEVNNIVAGITGAIDQLRAVSDGANERVENINERIDVLKEERKACNDTMDRADRIADKLAKIVE